MIPSLLLILGAVGPRISQLVAVGTSLSSTGRRQAGGQLLEMAYNCPHPSLTCFPELGHLWSTGLSLSHAVVTQAQRKEGIWIYPTMKFVTGSQRIGRLSLKSRESFSSPQYISQRLEEHAVTGQLPGPQYALPPRAPDGNGHLGLSTGRAGEVSDSSQGA